MERTTHADPTRYDPFEDDDVLSEAADDRPEPSPAEKARILAAAGADMERHLAQLQATIDAAPRVLNPRGPRQTRKAQRRLLFDALRTGLTRTAACERAEVDAALFDAWMQQPSFRASVDRAEQQANMVLTTDDYRRW